MKKYLIGLCVVLGAHCMPVEPTTAKAQAIDVVVYGPTFCVLRPYRWPAGWGQRTWCEQKSCNSFGCFTNSWWL